MPNSVENTDLYTDDSGSVSPSWLIEGSSRYAIRTVVHLEHKEFKPVTFGAICGFFAGIAVLVAGGYYYFIERVSSFIFAGFMIFGLFLCIAGALQWRSAKTRYLITIFLREGKEVQLTRHTLKDYQGMLDGLTEAMNWHRNGEFIIDADRASHINKRIAKGSPKKDPPDGDGDGDGDGPKKLYKSVLLKLPIGSRNR